jgi:hypothetical protein
MFRDISFENGRDTLLTYQYEDLISLFLMILLKFDFEAEVIDGIITAKLSEQYGDDKVVIPINLLQLGLIDFRKYNWY